MDGYQFEEQCAIILKRKHFSKIEVTKSSGDQGVDIIAYKHRKKYGIQCKYYTYPVGNKAVQEAYAGANFYDCDKVIVMTNTTFTRSAIELAEKLDVELWPDCPVTPFYSLLFKIMELLNLLLFLYAILTLFSAKYDFILCRFHLIRYRWWHSWHSLCFMESSAGSTSFVSDYRRSFPLPCIPCCAFTCISGNRLYIHTTALLNSCSCIHASCRVAEIKEDEK